MVSFRGIHHAGLVVDDLDAAIAFYGDLLDMTEIERDVWTAPAPSADQAVGLVGSSAVGAMLKGSGSYLELWEYTAPEQVGDAPAARGAHERGLRHLAIPTNGLAGSLTVLPGPGSTPTGGTVGDCDGNGTVDVAEVQTVINIFSGLDVVASCPAADANGSGTVDVTELQITINNHLGL